MHLNSHKKFFPPQLVGGLRSNKIGKYLILSIILLTLILFPAAKANAGFFSDGLKNAFQIVKSLIETKKETKNDIAPLQTDNKSDALKLPLNPLLIQDEAQKKENMPQPPTPWSDLSNIINLIKKEQKQLKNEFVPQKFLDRQESAEPNILIMDEFLALNLTTSADKMLTFFNINSEEFKEWQMRQEIINLLDKELNWYDQKLKEGLKMANRKKVDNLIVFTKNHRKEFRKTIIEPARISILINEAADALKTTQNRSIIVKNSVSNIQNESDRQIAEKLFSASQDKIKTVSIKIQNLKNSDDLTLEIAEPIILEINGLIKSIYEDFQIISAIL